MIRRETRYTSIGLFLVLLMGLGLRCYHVADRSIWFDEAFSWRLIQYPLAEMLHRITLDNCPPFYFILLKGWVACFGDSMLALRSLSVLAGEVAILAMFFLVRTVTSSPASADNTHRLPKGRATETALLAALFLAVSTFHIRWSWDVRPYALGTALALLSSWALIRALWSEKPARARWCVFVVVTVLFVYTHYFALFTVVAQAGFVMYVLHRDSEGDLRRLSRMSNARNAAVAFGLIGLCWLPWIPFFLRQASQVRAGFWIQPFHRWDLAHLLYRMFVEPENAALTETKSLWALDICVLAWVVLLWRSGRAEKYIAACALTPIALSILLDPLGIHVFLLRYLLFANAFFLAGLAMLITKGIPFPLERRIVSGVIVAGALFAWFSFCNKADFQNHPGTRAAAEWIMQEGQPTQQVIVGSSFAYLPMLYYFRNRGNCCLYRENTEIPHYLGTAVLRSEDFICADDLQNLESRRLWFVDTTGFHAGSEARLLFPASNAVRERRFPDVFGLGDIRVWQRTHPLPRSSAEPDILVFNIAIQFPEKQ